MKLKTALFTLVALVFSLAACTQVADIENTPEPENPAIETPVTGVGNAEETTNSDDLLGTWQWMSLAETEPASRSMVPMPENYTLTFLPGDEVSIKADCNIVGGTYALDGGLSIVPGPSTRAFCGEESLDTQYLDLLTQVISYTLEDDQLVLQLADGAGSMTFEMGSAEAEIVGIEWEWERFNDTAGINNIEVEDTNLYTLLLNADGTYEVKADCNQASGTYTLDGSNLTFEPGPTTLAECGEGSLYDTYLSQLGDVVTYVIDGDRLILNLWADAGNMVFIPAE